MGLSIKGNGLKTSELVMAARSGLMVRSTRECGQIIWRMEKAGLSILAEMCTKAIGSMIKLKEKESIFIKTEPHTQVNGWMTNKMDTESRNG